MARLALLAMLLLAALPSAGRLAASLQRDSGWSGLCTSAGLTWVRGGHPHGAPAMAHDGDDCGYCPLLHALDAPHEPPAFAARSPARIVSVAGSPASQRPRIVPLSGLGARGPPRAARATA